MPCKGYRYLVVQEVRTHEVETEPSFYTTPGGRKFSPPPAWFSSSIPNWKETHSIEESIPMNLSDVVNQLLSFEEQRDRFDINHCVVPQIADSLEGTVNLYCGVKDTSKPLVSLPYKAYGTSTVSSEQNEKDRIQVFMNLFPEQFNARHPKTSNNLARLSNYEVSVRLMDVTTEKLAALYFACHFDDSDKDGNPNREGGTANIPSPSCAVYLLRFDEGLSHVWTNPYFKEMINLAFEPQGLPIDLIQERYPVLSHELGDDLEDQGAWDGLSRPRLILTNGSPYFTKRQAAPRGHFIFFPPLFEVVSIDGKACLDQVPLFGKTPNGKRSADEYNRQLTTSFKVEIPSGSKSGIRMELEQLPFFWKQQSFPKTSTSS